MAHAKPKLDKFAIAAALQEIGALLGLKRGKERFKARAYQTAARVVGGLTDDIADLVRENRLTSLRGVGDAIASQIKQLHLTGTSSVLNQLRQEFPPGIVELSGVPGLSTDKVKQLHDALGVTSVAELRVAAEAGRVRDVKGFGAKTEASLLNALTNHQTRGRGETRLHIHHALRIADQVTNYLKTQRGIEEIALAGSARRWKETVGTTRLVVQTKTPAKLVEGFLKFPLIVEVIEQTKTNCLVRLAEGAKVSLVAVSSDEYVWALFAETGSDKHLKNIEQLSRSQKARSRTSRIKTEKEIYARLKMQYVPPELREDEGEIEAARAGTLPEDLVTAADIQGMVHCHTTYSDGKHSVEEMARAAEAMGMKYITITDHSPTAFYAGGVKIDQLKRQWDEIAEVQENVKIKLLRGTESDITADGSLDYPDKILEQFDVIVGSIHSRYKMDSEKMTKRIVTAMRQPVFKIWGHALGRLIQRRPPFECNVERILDVIAESRAAIEINGDPFRLDMEPRWIREARKRKIKFVISTDAHSTGALNNLKYGVGIARRGWVRRKEVLNTFSAKSFAAAVHP